MKKIGKSKGLASKVSVAVLITSTIITGCGGNVKLGNNDIQTQAFSTKQEIMDYYAASMKYGNISTRKVVSEDANGYNNIPENSETWNKLLENYKVALKEHSLNKEYSINENIHDYLKNFCDDIVLNNNAIKRAKEYGGFYFLTVEYSTSPNGLGTFKDLANYLGLDGIIVKDYKDNDNVDAAYGQAYMDNINKALESLKEPKINVISMKIEDDSNNAYIPETTANVTETTADVPETQAEIPETQTEVSETQNEESSVENNESIANKSNATDVTNAESSATEQLNQAETTKNEENKGNTSNSNSNNIRKLAYDIERFSKLAGSSQEQVAYMPRVSMVYNVTENSGLLSGFGMYRGGNAGLKDFGYDTSKDSGSIVITYVFKQDETNPDVMTYRGQFVNNYTNNNSFLADNNLTDSAITLPTFIDSQLSQIVERFDRAVNNNDISALMGNNIVEDDGLGLKLSLFGKCTNIVTYQTSINRVLARNENEYLVELKHISEESASQADLVAQYQDTYYAVVKQEGVKFKINDLVLGKREITKLPYIYPESSVDRRLIALNLSSTVTDTAKNDITNTLLKNLADYSTNRTVRDDGSIAMYECFNPDTTLLSSERKEYINSKIRGLLLGKGTKAKSTLYIQPDIWIGGYDTQVEFTTKEFVDYEGKDSGSYVENHYLVSHYGTEWLIDDIITTREEMVDGERYQQLLKEFKK